MAQTVIGFFDTTSEAQAAVDQLVKNGFSRESVDMSATTDSVNQTTGTNQTTGMNQATGTNQTTGMADTTPYSDNTTTRDDSNQGGIGKFFSSLFGGDDDDTTTRNRATTYGQVASQSDAIVTVHASSKEEAERAADILDEAGAFDIDERAAEYGFTDTKYGAATTATPAVETTNARTDTVETDGTLKVIQEDLQIGKRMVETGSVRVRSRIVEKPVEESLRLREERVRIQRNPVNRVATDADMNAFQQGEISMTEHAEVPVVSKEARVVEEISVGKEVNERAETIRDTVRSTEVDVEDTTDVNRTNANKGTMNTDTGATKTTDL